ncbi:MAG: glycosyltransferase [Thermoanaerobaculia bacterium]|nr:glycosyltransferase [Thermoanaerobaculia bacterium]
MTVAPLGFVSPLPPVRSGIADYSADLLAALRGEVALETYAPSEASAAIRAGHAAVLLQVGNDPLHLPSVEALRENAGRVPAILVLHDFSLHHLFAAGYLDAARVEDYARELERSHGAKGRALGDRARAGERVPVWDLAPWDWPMSLGVVGDAAAVVVHSSLVRGALLRRSVRAPVFEVPHLVAPAPEHDRAAARAALDLPRDRVVAATLGIVTPAKRIGRLLEGLALLPPGERPFLVVGGAVADDDPLREIVRGHGLADDVRFTGYLPEEDFWRLARAADVSVNLRFPTVGETSGAVCRLAGTGLPVVVSDVGWFRELPDSFAAKIPIGTGEVETIAAVLGELVRDAGKRRARAAAAAAWGAERSPARIAAAYARVVRAVLEGRAPSLAIPSRLAAALSAVGAGRPGVFGAAERGPDGTLVATAASRSFGVLPPPLVPFLTSEDV